MSKHNLKIVRPDDPARHALKISIDEYESAQKKTGEAAAALARGKDMQAEAQQKFDEASANLASARHAHADRLASAAASGSKANADSGGRDARSRQLDAEDDLTAAKRAVKSLERILLEAEEDAGRKLDGIAKDAKAVLACEVERILLEAESLHSQMATKRLDLHFLLRNSDVPDEMYQRVNSFFGRELDESNWEKHPALAPWREAHEALMTDASAELPR